MPRVPAAWRTREDAGLGGDDGGQAQEMDGAHSPRSATSTRERERMRSQASLSSSAISPLVAASAGTTSLELSMTTSTSQSHAIAFHNSHAGTRSPAVFAAACRLVAFPSQSQWWYLARPSPFSSSPLSELMARKRPPMSMLRHCAGHAAQCCTHSFSPSFRGRARSAAPTDHRYDAWARSNLGSRTRRSANFLHRVARLFAIVHASTTFLHTPSCARSTPLSHTTFALCHVMIEFGTSHLTFGVGARCVRCLGNIARRASQLAHSLGSTSSLAKIVRPARPGIEVAASTE
jgi:hypothetical protein